MRRGAVLSPEHRAKISLSQRQHYALHPERRAACGKRSRGRPAWLGKKHTTATRVKMRKTHLAAARVLGKAKGPRCDCCGFATKGGRVHDHSHATGEWRGYLCRQCNFGIGMFLDDPRLCEKAAAYLRRY